MREDILVLIQASISGGGWNPWTILCEVQRTSLLYFLFFSSDSYWRFDSIVLIVSQETLEATHFHVYSQNWTNFFWTTCLWRRFLFIHRSWLSSSEGCGSLPGQTSHSHFSLSALLAHLWWTAWKTCLRVIARTCSILTEAWTCWSDSSPLLGSGET